MLINNDLRRQNSARCSQNLTLQAGWTRDYVLVCGFLFPPVLKKKRQQVSLNLHNSSLLFSIGLNWPFKFFMLGIVWKQISNIQRAQFRKIIFLRLSLSEELPAALQTMPQRATPTRLRSLNLARPCFWRHWAKGRYGSLGKVGSVQGVRCQRIQLLQTMKIC